MTTDAELRQRIFDKSDNMSPEELIDFTIAETKKAMAEEICVDLNKALYQVKGQLRYFKGCKKKGTLSNRKRDLYLKYQGKATVLSGLLRSMEKEDIVRKTLEEKL